MKLPQINYGQVASGQTQGPGAALANYRGKQQILQSGVNAAAQVAEVQIKSDIALNSAAYTKATLDAQAYMQSKDVLTRQELLGMGMDEANQNIQWTNADGTEKQTFKRYEVEPAVMAQTMEQGIEEFGGKISSPRYANAWKRDARERSAEELLRITDRSTKEAKDFQYKEATATLTALDGDPVAQAAYAKSTPAFEGEPQQRARWVANAENNQLDADREVFTADAYDVINNAPDKQLGKFLEQMKDPDYREKEGLNTAQANAITRSAQAEIARRQRKADALAGNQNDLADKAGKEALQIYAKRIETGQPTSTNQYEQLKSTVQGTKYAEDFRIVDDAQGFAVIPYQDQIAELNKLNTIGTEKEFEIYQATMIRQQEGIRKEGYTFAVTNGGYPYIPIDLTDPASIDARKEQALEIGQNYNYPISPYAQDEVDAFSGMVNGMTINDKVAAAKTFESTPEIWDQFGVAGNNVYAVAGQSGDDNIMKSAFRGQEAINSKVVVLPPQNDFLFAANEYLGAAYGVNDQAAIIETAKAIYADKLPTEYQESGAIDDDIWEQALAEATGGVADINGFRIQIPRNSDPGVMQDYVDGFTPEMVRGLGGVNNWGDERAAELIQDGQWFAIDDNVYGVMSGNTVLMSPPQDGQPARPLQIEYSKDSATMTMATEFSDKKQKKRIINARFDSLRTGR